MSPEEVPGWIERSKAEWREHMASLPIKEKFRILIEMQKQDYPILAARRKMEWWEKPWDVEP